LWKRGISIIMPDTSLIRDLVRFQPGGKHEPQPSRMAYDRSTTAVNLAGGLAYKGLRVLVVDLDPQGHVARSLGLNRNDGAYYLLTMELDPASTQFIRQRMFLCPGWPGPCPGSTGPLMW